MWYIYNSDDIIIGTCSGEPNKGDLETRGEAAFEHEGRLNLLWQVVFDGVGKPIGAEPPTTDE